MTTGWQIVITAEAEVVPGPDQADEAEQIDVDEEAA